jgi:predicted DsbA family dithiol-disulfide isomerase
MERIARREPPKRTSGARGGEAARPKKCVMHNSSFFIFHSSLINMRYLLLLLLLQAACSQAQPTKTTTTVAEEKNIITTKTTVEKMKIEVWSDIVCPFCYIGKRHYEAALRKFAKADEVEIVWRSFQLDPDTKVAAGKKINSYQYLADRKGISYAESVEMHKGVSEMAKTAGLNYNFDKAIVANTFAAHCLLQKAKERGLGDAAKERLMAAYFMEGEDIGDAPTLHKLGQAIGLTEAEAKDALSNPVYAQRVADDMRTAEQLGISGVPFFVFDNKYALSGAQPVAIFEQTLQKAHNEWTIKQKQPSK